MSKFLVQKYMYKIREMNDKEYLFGIIWYNIAPTLEGHKPSSIITLSKNNRELNLLWQKYKQDFTSECGLDFYEIKNKKDSITLLFYNRCKIIDVIYKEENMKFLKMFGYNENLNLNEILDILKFRFEKVCPHEIGIFLGFPLDDVICFMKYPDKECLLCGYWKVYNNLDIARQKFIRFDKAKNNVVKSILRGNLPSLLLDSVELNTVKCSAL